MTMPIRVGLRAGCVAVLLGSGACLAQGGGPGNELTVQMEVDHVCAMWVPDQAEWKLDFGVFVPDQNVDGSLTFHVRCTGGTVYSIAADAGEHADAAGRNMAFSGSTDHTVPYGLFQDSARAQPWTTEEPNGPNVGTGGSRTYTLYGRIPPTPLPGAAGDYRDHVSISLVLE